jgi:hypothetical protein
VVLVEEARRAVFVPTVPMDASIPESIRMLGEPERCVLAPGVGMMNEFIAAFPLLVIAAPQTHVDGVEDKVGFLGHAACPADRSG